MEIRLAAKQTQRIFWGLKKTAVLSKLNPNHSNLNRKQVVGALGRHPPPHYGVISDCKQGPFDGRFFRFLPPRPKLGGPRGKSSGLLGLVNWKRRVQGTMSMYRERSEQNNMYAHTDDCRGLRTWHLTTTVRGLFTRSWRPS